MNCTTVSKPSQLDLDLLLIGLRIIGEQRGAAPYRRGAVPVPRRRLPAPAETPEIGLFDRPPRRACEEDPERWDGMG